MIDCPYLQTFGKSEVGFSFFTHLKPSRGCHYEHFSSVCTSFISLSSLAGISDTKLRHNDERLGDRVTLPQNSLRAVLEWREVFVRCQFIFAKGTGPTRNLNAGFGHCLPVFECKPIVWIVILQTRLLVWTFSPIVCVICRALFYVNMAHSTHYCFVSVICVCTDILFLF